MSLLFWVLTAAQAVPPDDRPADWWRGVMLADVDLRTEDGTLPEEDLEPLLKAIDGEPLDPADIQADLATLYRVGNFRAVEATVEPWPFQLPNGEAIEVAHLTYTVYNAPEIDRITILGNKRFSDRDLRDVLGIVDGQEFYLDLDGPAVEKRVRGWLERQGYPEPEVEVRASSLRNEPERQFVTISVDEGIPDTVESIQFSVEGAPVEERKLRRWAKRSGLEEGKPLVASSLPDTRERIKKRLGLVQKTPLRKTRGLVEARVTTLAGGPVGLKEVSISIEPGSKLEIEPTGISRRDVLRALSIDSRVRLTGGFLDSAPEELERYLQERGWYAAKVDVALIEEPGVNRLVVDADLGPRHFIGPRLPFPHRLGSSHASIEFDFEVTDLEERSTRLERDLQALFFLASPDVIGRHHYTEEEMEAGRERARTLLVKRGHLDAEVTIEEPRVEPRTGLSARLTRARGKDPRRRIWPRVVVTLGPITRLEGFRIEGLAPEVSRRASSYLRSALGEPVPRALTDEQVERWAAVLLGKSVQDRLVGGPYSPQEIEALRELVVTAHQAEGYLEADARVASTV
ncbi:MAG: POTRA domain-containing protein, partial [Myxococcota bacterium]